SQARRTELQIMCEFEKLHPFLKKEEAARIAEYKATAKTRDRCAAVPDPEVAPGGLAVAKEELVDVAKHLGNLCFRVWGKMKEIATCSDLMTCPGFTSSNASWAHSWDVVVGGHGFWRLGLTDGAMEGPGDQPDCCLWHMDGKYKVSSKSNPETTKLQVRARPERIRVFVDIYRGYMNLYDLINKKALYRLYHNFDKRVFPFVGSQSPLRIVPVKPTVSVPPHIY
ncbi:unnamed protein product, partial [Coregonus sp. 'balchen']